jgi:hypothetical protein
VTEEPTWVDLCSSSKTSSGSDGPFYLSTVERDDEPFLSDWRAREFRHKNHPVSSPLPYCDTGWGMTIFVRFLNLASLEAASIPFGNRTFWFQFHFHGIILPISSQV